VIAVGRLWPTLVLILAFTIFQAGSTNSSCCRCDTGCCGTVNGLLPFLPDQAKIVVRIVRHRHHRYCVMFRFISCHFLLSGVSCSIVHLPLPYLHHLHRSIQRRRGRRNSRIAWWASLRLRFVEVEVIAIVLLDVLLAVAVAVVGPFLSGCS
jgi:hypothetical protein